MVYKVISVPSDPYAASDDLIACRDGDTDDSPWESRIESTINTHCESGYTLENTIPIKQNGDTTAIQLYFKKTSASD